jgi:rare lipoprotein A
VPRPSAIVGLFAAILACAGCAHREDAGPPRAPAPGPELSSATYQVGIATWYGGSFAGKRTSNGERFDPNAMTAAHRKLPFNTWVEVCRVETRMCVRVRINDRGPWGNDRRIIDLSQHAARLLDFVEAGSTRVELRVLGGP